MPKTQTRHEQDTVTMHQMYECRKAARLILGDDYAASMVNWSAVIAAKMAEGQLSVLQAVIALGLHLDEHDGIPLMVLISAAVEMIERDDNYDGPQDLEAWDGGFAENH